MIDDHLPESALLRLGVEVVRKLLQQQPRHLLPVPRQPQEGHAVFPAPLDIRLVVRRTVRIGREGNNNQR